MTAQPGSIYVFPDSPTATDPAASQAAEILGKLLADTPEHQAYLESFQEVNRDVQAQRLSAAIRDHNAAIQWGRGNRLEHQTAVTALEAEIEALPSVRAYHQAEKAVTELFQAVDGVISQAAGLPFSPNATRSGCPCSR